MSSMFDTDVRLRREHTPWATVNFLSFIREVILNIPYDGDPREHEVTLSLRYRHDVASREWYTLEWTGADGEHKSISAQSFGLLKWRAAELEMRTRKKTEGGKPSGGE